MKIVVMASGTRGDIDPFLALSLGLEEAGYEVSVWVPPMFEPKVRAWGLSFAASAADAQRFGAIQPTEENARAVVRDSGRTAFLQTMESAWDASRDADAIVYHATMVAGPQIAEKMSIPRFAVLQAPVLSPTREFRNPLDLAPRTTPEEKHTSHLEVLELLYGPIRDLVETWRKERLALPPRPLESNPFLACDGLPTPVLYCSSPLLVPRPSDWPSDTAAAGFWLLPGRATWNPPRILMDFLASGPPPVYVGFGSMTHGDPAELARVVIRALELNGQRGILATGWGGMAPPESVPESMLVIKDAPHSWLFPQVKAVVHHGGASTTGAGLRAGKPTLILPFLSDQHYWAERVEDCGLGPSSIQRRAVNEEGLSAAIAELVGSEEMENQAAAFGEGLRREDGVRLAVGLIQEGLAKPSWSSNGRARSSLGWT